jgi:phosphoribosylaminoimidazolecarboxamide formyltransferase/IMP cyclohydrolase
VIDKKPTHPQDKATEGEEASPTDISQAKRLYRERNEGAFAQHITLRLQKEQDLKYGENPHQQAALYTLTSEGNHSERPSDARSQPVEIQAVRSDGRGKGGLSLTNWMDITRGIECLKYFADPAVVILKHNCLAGFACQEEEGQSLAELYRLARDSDRRSCFGGTVVCNRPLDEKITDALLELYPTHIVDVVAAPAFEEGQIKRLEAASQFMRLAAFSDISRLGRFVGEEGIAMPSIKELPTGRVALQDPLLTSIRSKADLILRPMARDQSGRAEVIARIPTPSELRDLLRAWYLNLAGARSNGVVLIRRGVLVACGAGQVERVGAVEQAIVKAIQKAFDREGLSYDPLLGISGIERLQDNPLLGAACASDAFFPFADAVEILGRMGVSAIIQPYGSVRDVEVIAAANRYGIAMPATLERCFGHF